MEAEVLRRKIDVKGVCTTPQGAVLLGVLGRAPALEVGGVAKRFCGYGWLFDCVVINDLIYAFGYGGIVVDGGLREIKRTVFIGAEYAATDGKLIYVVAEGGLLVFDAELQLRAKIGGKFYDVAADAEGGGVYVLGIRELYLVDEGRLRPAYRLDATMGAASFVLAYGGELYVSAARGLARLDASSLKERAFSPKLRGAAAVVGDYVASVYGDTVRVADRDSLSVLAELKLPGITAGFAKARSIGGRILTPAYAGAKNFWGHVLEIAP